MHCVVEEERLMFYGWTDYLLLNLSNTKDSHYPDRKADLIVFNLKRVSQELVDAIRDSGVFENVYILQPYRQDGITGFKNKLVRLMSGRKYYLYYANQLERLIGNAKYHALFTGAFWSETLHLIRFLFMNSPRMEVNFVSEGTAIYQDVKVLQMCMPRGGIREAIFRRLHYARSYNKACKQVRNIYNYSPNGVRSNELPLPQVCKSNSVGAILKQVATFADTNKYENARFYFFPSPRIAGLVDMTEEDQRIFGHLLEKATPQNVLVRLHPSSQKQDFRSAGAYLDTGAVMPEVVFSQVDMSEKVLVSPNSTALITPKLLFNKEPHIIMTHRLYKTHKIKDWQRNEAFFKQILELYDDKRRVYAPESNDELKEVVSSLCKNEASGGLE